VKERESYEVFAEDGEYEYVRLRSGLTARRRKQKPGENAVAQAREFQRRLEKQSSYFDDSTRIIRADRDAGWQ
jgi:hypothetical protein